MKPITIPLLTFLFAAATIAPAGALDTNRTELLKLSIEDLMSIPVGAASGFEQDISEAPSSVTILTRDDLRNFGYRTLAEALASIAGFYTTYDRTYHTLGVRGFNQPGDYSTRTLVLINGVRVNDPIYSTGRVGMDFPLNLDLIERIEVVRGPSSSLYGNSAFFAVINVITRAVRDVEPAELSVSAGSYDAFSGQFSAAQRFGSSGSFLLSGSLFNSAGDDLYFPLYDTPEANNGMATGLDGEHQDTLFLQARYGDWTLQAIHMDRRKERPTAAYGTLFNNPGGEDRDRETMVDASWDGSLAATCKGMIRLGYQRYAYGADWPYDYADEGNPMDRRVDEETAVAESVIGEARLITTIIPHNRLTAGADIRHTFRLDQQYVGNAITILDSRETQTDVGGYLQDEIRLAPWALVNAGLRYDHREPCGDSDVSPRTALILSPTDTSVFKLIYGKAFRAPNAFERFYDDNGTSSKANPELKPETIRTYELVVEQRVVAWFQLNASVYRYNIQNLISQIADPEDDLLVFRNVAKAEATGCEIEGRMDLPGDIKVRSSYAYCRAKDRDTGARLSNAPEHMAKVSLWSPTPLDWISAGVEAQYISERLTTQQQEAQEHVVVNATLLARRFAKRLDVSLSVYNLLDKNYVDPTGDQIEGATVAQDGRTFRLKAVYHF